MVVLQGGKVPEFEIQPDPAKLAQAGVTVPGILDAVAKTNMIDSPGLIENNHELSLTLVSGQTRDPAEIENIVVRTTPNGVPIRVGDVATVHPSGDAEMYTIVTGERKAGRAAEYFPTAGQQHSGCRGKGERGSRTDQEDAAVPGVKVPDLLRSIKVLVRD